jgi:signal transduction histidine kinase/signal recognition particle receptor subunit beta
MVQFDNQYRQIKIKIVYYGPALGGKTTCLHHIHHATDPQRRTKLYSLNTASDRTLFFDLLSLNLGRIRGYRLAMQLYTVPGQVQYNATRRAVLSGADGIVFVADSQTDQREANLESLDNLWENLSANGLDRETTPLVFLHNKRDLEPLLSIDDMDGALNPEGLPSFPSTAISGDGVMEGFAAISEATLVAVADKLGVGSNPQAVQRLKEQVKNALGPYVPAGEPAAGPAAEDLAVSRPEYPTADDKPLSQEMLVSEAVRANVAMTDLNVRLDTVRRDLERRVEVQAAITRFGQEVTSERDPDAVLRRLLESAVALLGVPAATVLEVPGSGEMQEAETHGVSEDPLLHQRDGVGDSIAMTVVAERSAQIIAGDIERSGEDLRLAAVEAAGFASAVSVPLVAQDRIVGLLNCYGGADRELLDEDDQQVAEMLAATAALGFANARAWQRLEEVNKGLEAQVAERTAELRSSLEEVQRLAKDLEGKNHLLEDAYRELSELDRVKDELITRISHELRTPVTSLMTAAKILERYRDAPAEKASRFVTIIRDEASKLSEIVQSVFQASVLAASKGRPAAQYIPANELFKRAVGPLRDLAKEREVSLQVLLPSGLDAVICDPDTMEAALRAVVKNGIEFNHKGGEVKVEVRRVVRADDPWLVITVSDNGVGVPEQELPNVFETFWQGGNVLTGKPRGVGLGLTIARRVARNHGGEIDISSRIAEGTEVTLAIPQLTPEEHA